MNHIKFCEELSLLMRKYDVKSLKSFNASFKEDGVLNVYYSEIIFQNEVTDNDIGE